MQPKLDYSANASRSTVGSNVVRLGPRAPAGSLPRKGGLPSFGDGSGDMVRPAPSRHPSALLDAPSRRIFLTSAGLPSGVAAGFFFNRTLRIDDPNCSVLMVSCRLLSDGLMFTKKHVLDWPPSESCSRCVSFEFRNGMCLSPARRPMKT